MNKSASIAAFSLIFLTSLTAWAGPAAGPELLKGGFLLADVTGRLIAVDANYPFHFRFHFTADANSPAGRIKAGRQLPVLPCSTLEKMTANLKDPNTACRLWARTTTYEDRNYLLPVYFLALTAEPNNVPSLAEKSHPDQPSQSINAPGDAFALPEQIAARLTTRKTTGTSRPPRATLRKPDVMLVDRTARLRKEPDGSFALQLDVLGRNIPNSTLSALPCQALRRARQAQAESRDSLLFKIAGIVTEYKNKKYLLLHQAVPVYNYGNFAQ